MTTTTQNTIEATALAMTVSSSIERLHKAAATMSARIFNANKTDYACPELFLGSEPSGLLDTLHRPYPVLFRLFEELKAGDWKHNEFNYSSCIEQFKTCSPSVYRMMIRTLAWQWEGDSTAGRSVGDILLPLCTCTETRVGYGRIMDNENLHALTYSEIVRGSFEDPSVILDEIQAVRESHGRMAVVASIMEEARLASLEWQSTGVATDAIRDAVFMLVAGLYMLERVQFMASFAVTFGICELGLFEPIGTAVQTICRDEYSNHVPFGEEVLRLVLATEWGMKSFVRCRQKLIDAHVELLLNEISWVDYLHSDGDELPGVTPNKLKAWSLFNARASTELTGITAEVEERLGMKMPTEIPLSFMTDWIDINEKQSSPQEQDNNQYLVNTVSTNNVSNEKYNFELTDHSSSIMN